MAKFPLAENFSLRRKKFPSAEKKFPLLKLNANITTFKLVLCVKYLRENLKGFVMSRKPSLIVFDLDFTLWPFYVDCSVTPPFRKSQRGDIFDRHLKTIECYKDVPAVLEDLHKSGYQLAVASRTGEVEGANQLIHLFGWDKYFSFKEIYPGRKTEHFKNFHKKSGIEFREMLFFDDENRNITDVRSLGVTCVWVENGITKGVIQQGLKRFFG